MGEWFDQVAAAKQPIRGETPFAGTFGRRIYDYILAPVFGADGEVEAVAGTARDVTERKAAEESPWDADRRTDDFVALLAHELRNSLAPIRNGLQVRRNPNTTRVGPAFPRSLSHCVRAVEARRNGASRRSSKSGPRRL